MTFFLTPLQLPLVATAIVCMTVGVAALHGRSARGAVAFFCLVIGVAIYAAGYACELGSPTVAAAMMWVRVQYIGFTLIPLFWWIFALQYGRFERWVRRTVPFLAVFPLIFIVVAWTPRLQVLLWRTVQASPRTAPWQPLVLDKTYGSLHLPLLVYMFGLCIAACAVLLAGIRRSGRHGHATAAAIIVAAVTPLAGNLVFGFRLSPGPDLDWSALALGVSALVLFWAVFHRDLFDFAPLVNQELVRHMADAIIVLDAENRVVSLNPSAEQILASSSRSARGRAAADVLHGWPGLSDWTANGVPGMREIGGPPWFEAHLSPLATKGGVTVGSLLILHDFTKRKHLEEELSHLAQHDTLTGLPNRILLEDRMSQALKLSSRTGVGVGILFLDLDRFKSVNDTYGHRIGDGYLAAAARLLVAVLRETDTVARLGGDEFVVMLPQCSTPHAVSAAAEKIVTVLRTPIQVEDATIPCTASVGTAWSTTDGYSVELLLQRADEAMYDSKASGGNTWRAWSPRLPERDSFLGDSPRTGSS
jgi:diguanylate cyclase (GGDEF)-like protein